MSGKVRLESSENLLTCSPGPTASNQTRLSQLNQHCGQFLLDLAFAASQVELRVLTVGFVSHRQPQTVRALVSDAEAFQLALYGQDFPLEPVQLGAVLDQVPDQNILVHPHDVLLPHAVAVLRGIYAVSEGKVILGRDGLFSAQYAG